MRFSMLFAALLGLPLLAGCSSASLTSRLNPYRIDVRQGNYVDQEMVSRLRKGMTRDQVRFVLGTPLIVDLFRNDRWDYVYRFTPGRGETEQRRLTVIFENDVLASVEGDVEAGSSGEAASEVRTPARVIDFPAPDSAKAGN